MSSLFCGPPNSIGKREHTSLREGRFINESSALDPISKLRLDKGLKTV